MIVTKRRPIRVVLSLLLFVLVGSFFLAAQPGPQPASPLESLLNGSSSDIPGALSSLNDADLPLALAVAEALKFKALHGDTKIPVEKAEAFQQAVTGRIGQSQTVSLTKSAACPITVPARKTSMAGLELTVPACYRAEQPLIITAFGPQGEAGSPFPEVWVDVSTDHPPVQVQMVIDGKSVFPFPSKPGKYQYRPAVSIDGLFVVGTHTVEVSITDSTNRKVTNAWQFTVGLDAVAAPWVPSDAVLIGSFTISMSSLFPDSVVKGDVLVKVFQTKDGRTMYEYSLFNVKGSKYPTLRTTSLFLLRNFCSRSPVSGNRGAWINKPHAPYVFTGNELSLEAGIEHGPYTTVDKVVWKINELDAPSYQYLEGLTIKWKIRINTSFQVVVDVTIQYPDGPVQGQWVTGEYIVKTLEPSLSIFPRRQFLLIETATASLVLEGSRSIRDPGAARPYQDLIEENKIPNFPTGTDGILTVRRSRWKVVSGTAEAVPENIFASKTTNLLFPGKGFVELVHDVALSYDYKDEHYEMDFKPTESALLGVFPFTVSTKFAQIPLGIIFKTSRLVKFQEINLTIDGHQRSLTSMDGGICNIDPPIILGQSSLFPEAKPLAVEILASYFIRQVKGGFELLPRVSNFQLTLRYEKPDQASASEMLIRPYFISGAPGKTLDRKADDLGDFFYWLRPLSDWLSVKTFNNPAEIIQVAIDPSDPEVFEGQKFEFTGAIVPKPGMGTGEITEKGGSLDLLDGYQSQTVEKIEWDAIFHPHHEFWKAGSGFDFQFEPKKGTGTYEIVASAVVSVKEKDTASLAKANAISSTTATVKAGLKILTPVDGFAYLVDRKIRVTTTRDEEQEEQLSWKTITWKLNGKAWNPEGPPAFLFPEVAGDMVLTASQKVMQNGKEVVLSDQVTFSVKPVSISLSPVRKVYSPSPKVVPLTLSVKLGEKEITALDQVVDWATGTMKAQVKGIDWKAFTAPNTEAPLGVNTPPLSANAQLSAEGALTVFATVTVRVWSIDPNNPFDETVSFPAVRSDLWSFKTPIATLVKGKFPDKAITGTKRLYEVEKVDFQFGGGPFSWVPGVPAKGFEPEFKKSPAIPGVSPITSKILVLIWKEKNNPPATGAKFTPKFGGDEIDATVNLELKLDLAEDGSIQFPILMYTVILVSFDKAVEVKVLAEPNSVSINKPSMVSFYFGEKGGVITQQKELKLWDGISECKITLKQVVWREHDIHSETAHQLPQTTPTISFSRPIPGIYYLSGEGLFSIEQKEGPEFVTEDSLKSDLAKILINAKVLSWSVLPEKVDHLERIAIVPDDQEIPYDECYKNHGHWVWKQDGGPSPTTQPLAVGCDSSFFLKAVFGPVKPGFTQITYDWFSGSGAPVNVSGVVDYNDGGEIPTPPLIGVYKLQLSVDGCNEIAMLTPIFVVQKITQKTHRKIYFTECIKDSTEALLGKGKEISPKELVDTFFDWWWDDKKNELKYWEDAWETYEVVRKKGGMCQGLGNYFFKSLDCHGIEGLQRTSLLLMDSQSPERTISNIDGLHLAGNRSTHPWTTEYWGAVIYTDPGLNQTSPGGLIPYPSNIENIYANSKVKIFNKALFIPPVATFAVVIDFPADVTTHDSFQCYSFLAPKDGHAFVVFKDPSSGKAFLYDPTFGKGSLGKIEIANLVPGEVVLKGLAAEPNDKGLWKYLTASVAYFRGYTFFKSDQFESGISVFDIPSSYINYLKVEVWKYPSAEDNQ